MTDTRGSQSPVLQPRVVIATVLVIAALGLSVVVVQGLQDNLVYYLTPSELLDKGEEGVGASVRLGGMVQAGSVDWQPDDNLLRFVMFDKDGTMAVESRAVPPQMFREGIGVVVEGRLQEDGTFSSNRLMVKHGNEYTAPTDGEHPDLNELAKSLQEGES